MTAARVEQLSRESFAPFGRVVTCPGGNPGASGPGWKWWGDSLLLEGDGRAWGVGYLELEPTEPRFDWAEHHLQTVEAVLATSGDLLAYVAPPGDRTSPPLEQFRVFRVPAGAGIVMDAGVWHGAPFALDRRTSALVLLLEGTGESDVTISRFPETPIEIQVTR